MSPVKKFKNSQIGQSLIEILIGVVILGVVAAGLIGSTTRSVNQVLFAKEKSQAENFAREGLEWLVRYRREQGWPKITSFAGNGYCLGDLGELNAANLFQTTDSLVADCDPIPGTETNIPYRRFVQFDPLNDRFINLKFYIEWYSPRGTENFNLTYSLSDS